MSLKIGLDTDARSAHTCVMPTDITERAVREALKAAESVTEAAVLLGVSRRTMYRLMARHGIEIKRIVA